MVSITITNLMEKFKESYEESDQISIASELETFIKSITDSANKKTKNKFNLKELREKFTEYCPEFAKPLDESLRNSQVLEFTSKVLFEIGPKTKKKSKLKIVEKFEFKKEETHTDGAVLVTKSVLVTNLRKKFFTDHILKGVLVLSLQEASLLAMTTYMNIIDVKYASTQRHITTRLCGAVYKKDSIPKAAEFLKKDECTVSKIMNSSTIRCGYYLEYSDMACALIAAFESINNLDASIKEELLRNTVMNYISEGKEFKSKSLLAFGECSSNFQLYQIIKMVSDLQCNAETLQSENGSKVEPNQNSS